MTRRALIVVALMFVTTIGAAAVWQRTGFDAEGVPRWPAHRAEYDRQQRAWESGTCKGQQCIAHFRRVAERLEALPPHEDYDAARAAEITSLRAEADLLVLLHARDDDTDAATLAAARSRSRVLREKAFDAAEAAGLISREHEQAKQFGTG